MNILDEKSFNCYSCILFKLTNNLFNCFFHSIGIAFVKINLKSDTFYHRTIFNTGKTKVALILNKKYSSKPIEQKMIKPKAQGRTFILSQRNLAFKSLKLFIGLISIWFTTAIILLLLL